jgi:lipopolysaccharide transport system ATP-binding protein
MSDIAIEANHVWKKFHRGELHDSLRDLIPALAKRLAGRGPQRSELGQDDFWALQDINFQVRRGEALGIIGPNGAGKSTVLKLLSKILKPTRGSCKVRGSVGALIEIGAGFHVDLTGRENIYLQGAIMGMKRAQIVQRLDEIIEFAGVMEFIDTPVKRYSTGMYTRLGFSIAAHLDPDVLLIDEVLSVGDMAFQRRCVERMEDFKRHGVAIVFVSHNLQAVASLCDTALYVGGEACAQGPAREVIRTYVHAGEGDVTVSSGAAVEIVTAQLLDSQGRHADVVQPGSRLTLRVTYAVREAVADLTLGFILYRSTDLLTVYDGNLGGSELGLEFLSPGEKITVEFGFRVHLTRGLYHLACHVLHNPTHQFLSRLCPASMFNVQETQTYGGVADLELVCTVAERIPGFIGVRRSS